MLNYRYPLPVTVSGVGGLWYCIYYYSNDTLSSFFVDCLIDFFEDEIKSLKFLGEKEGFVLCADSLELRIMTRTSLPSLCLRLAG
jgi:hypothetical protein